jgi:hypothetical protein
VGDLGRFEYLGERVEAPVRHFGDTDRHGGAADARLLMDACENGEKRCFADLRQSDNGSFQL